MATTDPRAPWRVRLVALLALACPLGAMAVLISVSGPSGLMILGIGLAGLAAAAAGTWWALSHHGPVRAVGALLAIAAPAVVLVLYTRAGLWPAALAAIALLAGGLAFARSALRSAHTTHGMHAVACAAPTQAVLIMNPKSGGGKVGRFGLAEKAEALGARVMLLDTSMQTDVAALARRAVAEGADLLGVAGGDGTQAQVAEVAAEHDLPFLVVSAGTRNHFAMDLGLDRDDPSLCLDALTDGEELRVDLGMVSGRAFVNTVSFGVYAQIVQQPEYRDAKTGVALAALPDLLLGFAGQPLDALSDGTRLEAQQALLVSNNPYAAPGPLAAGGRRPRLDLGTLGVVGVRVRNAAQATEVALRGTKAAGLHVLTSPQVTVSADGESIPVAVDGEALQLPTPVTCSIRQGALRVRVPKHRPGSPASRPPLEWRQILALAFGRPLRGPTVEDQAGR
ncbi:diacylglycerol/lipid kinase family protein [Kitasatospora purpeofusca]|uniref:diacylglycerol/lipid kinase family protein n=1 Tax=Kitasatospora purpeofusca TaxID=67352 RepID=UPI00224D6240|nr:diacylglycerol kinase family protein [Kitasatospora purpeofusca]MCX4757228.1 diacylglycerol kinase family protein [Kitasatospora purpeofusca]WSR35017.1 diacylglycerol kinase family protein [Kitasatospora purpeofusca]